MIKINLSFKIIIIYLFKKKESCALDVIELKCDKMESKPSALSFFKK
jgi:hypothetical protein